MKFRIWPRSRILQILWLLVAAVLVPYLVSRLASPWRCVSIHSSGGSTEPIANRSPSLRIACYNIAHGRGVAESNWEGGNRAERKDRLDRIATLLRESNADIVVLNEVDFDASWSHSVNQAKYLAEKAGYPYRVEERNLDFRVLFWTWRFGNAVLSKHPITDAKVVQLPEFEDWETRLAGKKRAVCCEIDVNDLPVRVIAAHLSHRSESVRVRSARMLGKMAAGSERPTIVAGDMNSTPTGFPDSTSDDNGDNAMDVFHDSGHFRRSPQTAPSDDGELTFHSTKPQSIIDWVLIPDDWAFTEYVIHSETLSDHRLIVADVLPKAE